MAAAAPSGRTSTHMWMPGPDARPPARPGYGGAGRADHRDPGASHPPRSKRTGRSMREAVPCASTAVSPDGPAPPGDTAVDVAVHRVGAVTGGRCSDARRDAPGTGMWAAPGGGQVTGQAPGTPPPGCRARRSAGRGRRRRSAPGGGRGPLGTRGHPGAKATSAAYPARARRIRPLGVHRCVPPPPVAARVTPARRLFCRPRDRPCHLSVHRCVPSGVTYADLVV